MTIENQAFIIYFDFFFMGLSQFHDQSHEFNRLTQVKSYYFFL